jgi:hypothetical protein
MADVTFYGCDDYPVMYGKALPESINGGGGTDLRTGIAMAIRDGARAVVIITDTITPWPTGEEIAASGVPIIIGANATAPDFEHPNYRPGYWTPPEEATIIPVVNRDR